MGIPAGQPQSPAPSGQNRRPPDKKPEGGVSKVLAALCPQGNGTERRSGRRHPYPYLVQLTPVGDDGITAVGETVVVVGKHLSEHGMGFYHPAPLPHRRMIALLETAGVRLALLIDVTWCRFLKQGWYESGGRFLQTVHVPVGPADTANN
ncbi:MAG TPA: hypothetical protein VMY37_26440 [Thermoguttaceae bacterium]|nr:hypothetical protein [Thermoguttaceae bacterium]